MMFDSLDTLRCKRQPQR